MSKDFILLESTIWHGQPKEARHLSQGEHILFGGKIWIILDAGFKDEAKYPNDLEIKLYSLQEHDDAKKRVQEQTIIVARDYEIQPLIISVSPARHQEQEEQEEPEITNTYDPDDPNCTCPGSTDVHCPSHGSDPINATTST